MQCSHHETHGHNCTTRHLGNGLISVKEALRTLLVGSLSKHDVDGCENVI